MTTKARKKKVMFDESIAIKAYALRKTTDYSYVMIGKKLNICEKSVKKWADQVEKDPNLRATAEKLIKNSSIKRTPVTLPKKKPVKKKTTTKNGIEEIMRLTNENNYLRWCNVGLQQGFISRLLEENK